VDGINHPLLVLALWQRSRADLGGHVCGLVLGFVQAFLEREVRRRWQKFKPGAVV
jgi:hypothetical protein